MTPEEETEADATYRKIERIYKRELTRRNGPRKLRERKNQRYLRMLIRKHTEPVLRTILKAMSTANVVCPSYPLLCVEFLTEADLDRPLGEIIDPFNDIYRNRPIRIVEINGPEYIVEISGGGGCAGDGGTFSLIREGDSFRVKEKLRTYIS